MSYSDGIIFVMPIEANPPPMVAYFPRQQPEKVLSLNEQENEEQHKKGPSERVRGPRVEIQSKRQGVIAAVREHRSRGQSEFGEVGSDQDRSTVLVETKGGHKEIGTVDGADSVRGYVDELTNRHELVLSRLGIEQSAIVETLIRWKDSSLTVDEVQNQARLGIQEQLPKLEVLANDLRHEMSVQELKELFQLNPEALRKVGFTELADVAKHQDRLVGVANGVVKDIIETGGDLSKVEQIVEVATGKKNEANARNILALAEVGLIAAVAATKDKKLRSALSVAILTRHQ